MKALRNLTALLLGVLVPTQSGVAQQMTQDVEVAIMPTGEAILQWFAKDGRTYFIQASDPNNHLGTWIWSDLIESGHDHVISHEVGNTTEKGFFRLHYTDTPPPAGVELEDWDADGDGLSNALELDEQGNPLNTDTNGDGIPDGWAYAHGLSLTGNNASGLFQGGPSTNLEAYQQGVQANPASTINDHDGDGVENDDDADPQDSDVDWEPTRIGGYVMIDINVPEEAGLVRDFNDAGHVLFDGGIWNAGVWTELEQVEIEGSFHLDPHDFTYESVGNHGWKLSPAGDILELGSFNVSGPGDSEGLNHVLRRSYQPQNSSYQSAVSTLHTLDWYGLLGYSFLSLQVLGEDSQGRVFSFKKFDPALPEESAPEIWILNSNLAQSSYRQLPTGYHLHLHGNQVTPAGWLAVNASPHTGNTPAARTIIWNPAGQEITTAGGLPWYFSGLTELPHGKPALACRYHGSNGLVYLMNQSGDGLKSAKKLGGKNIHTFAGDGTAMTSDGKMWINGELTPLRDLCERYGELLDDGWNLQPLKANKHGEYLIQAEGPEEQQLVMRATPVNLSITNSDSPFLISFLPEDKEETVGAFTVANLNDQDGDGTVDNVDQSIKAQGGVGEDEEDLMLLKIQGSRDGQMKVTVASGQVCFWEKKTKETPYPIQDGAITIEGVDLPKYLYVEATAKSQSLRDIVLDLSHVAPDGTVYDDLDKVYATAVWAEQKSIRNTAGMGLWTPNHDASFKNTFDNIIGQWGINFSPLATDPTQSFHYSIGIEFELFPPGIAQEPGVKFDIARDIAFREWLVTKSPFTALQNYIPGDDDVLDLADLADDDDPIHGDEDVTGTGDRVYVLDGPGHRVGFNLSDEIVSRNNFNEWVRVYFNGNRPSGNNNSGSRCSSKYKWHAQYHVEWDTASSKYQQKANTSNSVDTNHIPLGAAPNP
ncbi:MAG: hypothetical protein MUF86_06845 [Akkermansiaceae bacterium]|jgi:hypothetical protein|nr:hypothetical protein [Akkermansiaceae bacterium]